MSSQATNICFYSNKCQWSKAFITELAKTPWKGQFRFICVDPGANRPQLPGWLKKVPTIVIAGEAEPRTDSDVMNWLMEKRLKEDITAYRRARATLGPLISEGKLRRYVDTTMQQHARLVYTRAVAMWSHYTMYATIMYEGKRSTAISPAPR
jgi:hypothetical protein